MKIERLISMIYMLLNNEVVSASDLAAKYQVSQRTIYRDIDTICAAGIPVVSYQGVNGGYGIMETYKMDKSLLNAFDIETILTMLKGLSGVFVDEQTMETVRKLQTIQPEGPQAGMALDIGSRWSSKETLRLLKSAIKTRKVVSMEYISIKNERSCRTVEPVCLIYKNNTWYLYAYCRSRRDYREFRLSRMDNVQSLQEQFHAQHAMPDQQPDAYKRTNSEAAFDATIRFSPRSLARALDFFNGRENEKRFNSDGSLTLTLKLSSKDEIRWLMPIILSFGEEAELEGPAEWRTQMKTVVHQILAKYE
ncbi:YafY family transcriptional regulator [Paenibacillus nanensis]|uniref:YafY family transcriptional regulator n=1 Tax=Paenibacillus nanensis TaxID=393251 RepID=A0A3A1UVF9_9BACL|nr:YafY family protein [Paenibacillus nanensis]RIX52487.1 YafY family transcriptional regulator [Paenibacillus nanensis]